MKIYKKPLKIFTIIICISFSILIIIFLIWSFLGGSKYFSIFDIGYYEEKFSCHMDSDCVIREYNNTCINKTYDGGMKNELKKVPIKSYNCKCSNLIIMNHCTKK